MVTTVSSIQNAKDFAATIESWVTAVAIVFGAMWAYMRFVRDRVYRPRLELSVDGGVLESGGQGALVVHVAVRNLGGSKVRLLRNGTGVRVLGSTDPGPGTSKLVAWERITTFRIMEQHGWIESSERITDEALLVPDEIAGAYLKLVARLVIYRRWPRKNVAIHAVRVLTRNRKWKETTT